jgi:serpin B
MVKTLLVFSVLIAVIGTVLLLHAQGNSAPESAIVQIEKLGANVHQNEEQPGKPIVGVNLSPVDGALKELVQGNNQFALDFYRQLAQGETGNIAFSPYSISTALAMSYAGARGKTAEEMAKLLHFTLGQEKLHSAFNVLSTDLRKEYKSRPYDLHIANALWGQRGWPFVKEFVSLMDRAYGGGLKEVDFEAATEEARQIINHWVEEQTKDKIKKLLQRGDVGSKTVLVLANAIYFKATWQHPFPEADTADGDFQLFNGERVLVALMHHRKARCNYFVGNGFHWLELPYQGQRLAMVVLLPQAKDKLGELEKALTVEAIQRAIENLRLHEGEVWLPRFITTQRESYKLNKQLASLGMRLAFTPAADFSGITSRRIWITGVYHKAYVAVDEVGTEAAASTAVAFGRKAVPSFSFRADHAFLFLIRDRQSGSILFFGRVANPLDGGGQG